jgi:hypothetical protein
MGTDTRKCETPADSLSKSLSFKDNQTKSKQIRLFQSFRLVGKSAVIGLVPLIPWLPYSTEYLLCSF